MSKVEIDWYHSQRDLDTAMEEFTEFWEYNFHIYDDFEVQYSYDTDYTGRELIVVTITSPLPMREFEGMIEGTSTSAGLIEFLNEWTSGGTGVSFKYV